MSESATTALDNFTAAFDKLAELGDKPVPMDALAGIPAEPAAPAAGEVKTEEPAAPASVEGEAPPKEPAAPVEGEIKTEEPAAPVEGEVKTEEPAAPAKPVPSASDDMLNRLADLVRERPAAPAAPEPPKAETPPEEPYTPDEKALLAKYEEDWPDVAKAETLRRREEYREIVKFVFAEVAKEVGPALQLVRSLAERTHLGDIRAKVDDYDNIREKVVDWVAGQPAYLRSAYETVVQSGTPDDVADLIARYRAETGDTTRVAAPAAKKPDTELPPATKQAAAALAPVSSKRSAVIQGVDPNDFDSAFAEAAKV